MEKEMSMIIPEPKQIVPRQGFVVDEGKHICAGRESFSLRKTFSSCTEEKESGKG